MHAKIFSATTVGIDAHPVDVEVDLSMGIIAFNIVGLPDKAIKESKDRIRAAIKNSSLRVPERAITVNLAPASLKKQDILFDVPIAIAILCAERSLTLSPTFLQESLFLGELSLDGTIRPIRGVLSIAHMALKMGRKRLIIPKANTKEASLIKGIEVIGVESLSQLAAYLRGQVAIKSTPSTFDSFQGSIRSHPLDFSQVKGQWQAKRALQIAAAGGHNILFIGPPGSGKTMLAKRLATILPAMSFDEVIETTKIYSIAGLLKRESLVVHRPFRAPHHTISQAGLVGGGSNPRPGEISLANNGVLFLDELTEFRRSTLEVLRQPLEGKQVLISRASMSVEYPAAFLLVAALNPCPCGYFGDKGKECTCTDREIKKYIGKLSGPLLDRIDLHVSVMSVDYEELQKEPQAQDSQSRGSQSHDPQQSQRNKSKSSTQMFEAVLRAVAFGKTRAGTITNANLTSDQVEKYCTLSPAAEQIIKLAFEKLHLSMRGYHKILKIARTIADLSESAQIEQPHIQEAIMYRSLDQQEG